MNRSVLMLGLFLTGCASPEPEIVVPPELTREVVVICPMGDTMRALGNCAILLRGGLNTANDKLRTIEDLVNGASEG